MRRTGIIALIVIVPVILAAVYLLTPRAALHAAKAQAVKKYTASKETEKTLNSVPQSPPRQIIPDTNHHDTVWLTVTDTDVALGFPADRFTRDRNPKRENLVIHHAKYRALLTSGFDAKEFTPVMLTLGFTNLYDFVLSAFRATPQNISHQSSMEALLRHQILLDAKSMLAPVGFESSCIEFVRGDIKGFIIGDPAQTKNIYMLVYIESQQQFLDIGVIQETPIQLSDLEELISVLRVSRSR